MGVLGRAPYKIKTLEDLRQRAEDERAWATTHGALADELATAGLATKLYTWKTLQQQEEVYGWQMMSEQERHEHQQQMREMKTEPEREAFRKQHHEKMQERARQQGLTLPDSRGPHGKGMGPGSGHQGRGGK